MEGGVEFGDVGAVGKEFRDGADYAKGGGVVSVWVLLEEEGIRGEKDRGTTHRGAKSLNSAIR